MNKTPLCLTIAALLALAIPAHALRARGPEPAQPGQEERDRRAGESKEGPEAGARPEFAPEDALEKKQRSMVTATPMSVEAKDGVQAFKDGFITRDGKSILFRKGDERATVLFTLEKEAAGWWALGDGSGVVYAADGKLRFKPVEGEEKELGAAPDGAPSVSAGTSRIAWVSGGHLWVANVGQAAAHEVALPEGRVLDSLALTPDGMNLYASFHDAAGEKKNWDIASLAPFTESKLGWSTRLKCPEGAPTNMAAGNDGTIVYTQPHAAGAKSNLQVLTAGQVEPLTLAVAEGMSDVQLTNGLASACFSAKGANGRRKIWRADLHLRPKSRELVTECIAEFENSDCAGMTRTTASGSAWFVKKTDGAADRVCSLTGF
jgi:hypothetical protein